MFVEALTLPGINLPETVYIQSSMNKFEFDFLESIEFRCHFNFCAGQAIFLADFFNLPVAVLHADYQHI